MKNVCRAAKAALHTFFLIETAAVLNHEVLISFLRIPSLTETAMNQQVEEEVGVVSGAASPLRCVRLSATVKYRYAPSFAV